MTVGKLIGSFYNKTCDNTGGQQAMLHNIATPGKTLLQKLLSSSPSASGPTSTAASTPLMGHPHALPPPAWEYPQEE